MNRTRFIITLTLIAAVGLVTGASASVFSGSATPALKSLATGTQPPVIDAAEYQQQLNERFENVIRNEAYLRSRDGRGVASGTVGVGRGGGRFGDVNSGYYLRGGNDIGAKVGKKFKDKEARDNRGQQKKHGIEEGGGGGSHAVEPAPEPATWVLLITALVAAAIYLGPMRRLSASRMLG